MTQHVVGTPVRAPGLNGVARMPAHGLPRQWRLALRVVAAGLLGALLGGAIGLLIPRTYTSAAQLLFPSPSGRGGSPAGAAEPISPEAGAGGVPGGSGDQPSLLLMQGVLSMPQPGTSPATAGLILKSRKTTAELVRRFRLDSAWKMPFDEAMEQLEREFRCYTSGSGVLSVLYTDRSPERSQEIVTEAIGLLTSSVEELSLDPAGRNLRLLRESLTSAEASCASAQEKLVRFQRKLGGIPPDMRVQSLGQTYSELQQDLLRAEVEGNVARSQARAVSDLSERMIHSAQDPSGSSASLMSSLYRTLLDRQAELALLRQKYTEKHPEVVQARRTAEVAERTLESEVRRQMAGIRSGASPLVKDAVVAAIATQARSEGLQSASRRVAATLASLPAAQATYTQLNLNLRDERSRLALVRAEYVKAELIAQSRGPQFVLLDPPAVPRKPNGYPPLAYAAAGFVLLPVLMALAALRTWIGGWFKVE